MTQSEEDTAQDRLVVPLHRWAVYRHLRRLCAKDGRFEIDDYMMDPPPELLEKLHVYDTQKLKGAKGEKAKRRARIGTVSLLPWIDNTTVIMFDGKDAATEEGRTLFRQFPPLVQGHFGAIFPTEDGAGKWGRGCPGLDHDELIYRLAKAQEAEEIKQHNPSMTWKEIALQIGWRQGSNKAGVKLLEDARKRLDRLEHADPENLLEEVAQLRREKKEM